MTKSEFIEIYTTGDYDKYDIQVISFIAEILYDKRNETDCIRSFFRGGYCYHFASILLESFRRGKLCIAEPFGHIIWQDVDGLCYDIEGPYVPKEQECERITDIRFLEDTVYDFIHIPGKEYHAPYDFHIWAEFMHFNDTFAIIKVYQEIPREEVDYNKTLPENAYNYWLDHKMELQEKLCNLRRDFIYEGEKVKNE